MDFKDLNSEETLQGALNWAAEYIQGAILNKEKKVTFTFSPNESNSLIEIFDFTKRLGEALKTYGFLSWNVLDNKNEIVILRVII